LRYQLQPVQVKLFSPSMGARTVNSAEYDYLTYHQSLNDELFIV